MKKIYVTVTVTPPAGATHYEGALLEDPTWYKQHPVAGFLVWFRWHADRLFHPAGGEWVLHGDDRPHWCKRIVWRCAGPR